MFLASIFVQGSIILGIIILFIVTYWLNKKIKVPKGQELPEKCQGCTSNTCLINNKTVEKITAEMKEYIDKECEDNEKE